MGLLYMACAHITTRHFFNTARFFLPWNFYFFSGIWYYLQCITIYFRSQFWASLSTRTSKKHILWLVQPLVFIVDLDRGCKQNKSLLRVKTLIMTQCSLQLCLCLFYKQSQCWIYGSSEALYGECSYIEENHTQLGCPIGITEKHLQYYNKKYKQLLRQPAYILHNSKCRYIFVAFSTISLLKHT